MQNYQHNIDRQTGPNVSLGQVTQANTAGLQAGLGAIEGIDNFRKIKNKNTIMDLLKNSDSANFGKNAGQIMSLSADTTAGGAKAAQQGLTAFQNKATSDLTGLGKILAANKGSTASNQRSLVRMAEAKAVAQGKNRKIMKGESDAKYEAFLTANNAKRDKAARTYNALIATAGANGGNQARVDDASRTMNKYFDRKMNFGGGIGGNGVGGNGGNGGDGRDKKPAPLAIPSEQGIVQDIVNQQGQNGKTFFPGQTVGTKALSRFLPNGKPNPYYRGPKNVDGDYVSRIGNSKGQPTVKEALINPQKKLNAPDGQKRIGGPVIDTEVVPGTERKIGSNLTADGQPKVIKESTGPKIQNAGKNLPVVADIQNIDAKINDFQAPKGVKQKLKSMYRQGVISMQEMGDIVSGKVDWRNVKSIAKEAGKGAGVELVGEALSSPHMSTKRLMEQYRKEGLAGNKEAMNRYNQWVINQDKKIRNDESGNTVDEFSSMSDVAATKVAQFFGLGWQGDDTNRITDQDKTQADSILSQLKAEKGGKQLPTATEVIANGSTVSKTPGTKNTGSNAFTMDFNRKDIVDTYSSAAQVKKQLKTEIGQLRAALTNPNMPQDAVDNYNRVLADREAQLIEINNNGDYATNRMMANIEQKSPQLASTMNKGVNGFISQVISNPEDAKRIMANMSPRAKEIFTNILKSNTKMVDGQLSVSLGDDAKFGGDPVLFTGKDRQELGKNMLMLMTQLTQNPADAMEFVDSRPENQRQTLIDLINRNSNSVPANRRSANAGRHMRGDSVAGSNHFIPKYSDSDIVNEALNATVR